MTRNNLDKYMVFIEDEAIEVRRATRQLAVKMALCCLAACAASGILAVVVGLLLDWHIGFIVIAALGLSLVFGYMLSICWLRDADDDRALHQRSLL